MTVDTCCRAGSSRGGLFHRWERKDSSLSNELMPGGFPIAPQWISPILTAGLTATECLSASESAEIAPVRLHSCNVVSTPGIRWVRWGGRGDEMRLRGVVTFGHPGPIRLSRPVADDRHRSHVTGRESSGFVRTQCTCTLQRLRSVSADFSSAQRHMRPVHH